MSNVLQKQVGLSPGGTTASNSEGLIAYSNRVQVGLPTVRAIVKGWVNVTFGTGVTAAQARLRRGNGTTGAVVGAAVSVTSAAANSEEISIQFAEQLLGLEYCDYSLTLTCTGGTGTNTINQGMIEVELING